MDEIKAQFETNFFGPVRVMQGCITYHDKPKAWTDIEVSSLGGRIAFPFDSAVLLVVFPTDGCFRMDEPLDRLQT